MGNVCGNQDIYQQLVSKYPEQLKKYIVGEEIKKGLSHTIDGLQGKVGEQSNQIKEANLQVIEGKK